MEIKLENFYFINILICDCVQFMLAIIGDKAAPEFRSGALNLEREIMNGKQDYETDSKEWPVNQPTIKVEARAQCSGSNSF
jgi:xanthine dehydrogenase/oxidase